MKGKQSRASHQPSQDLNFCLSNLALIFGVLTWDNQSMDVNKSKRQVLKSNTKQNEKKKNPFQASKTVKANFSPENKTQGIHRCHGAKPAMLKKLPTKVH